MNWKNIENYDLAPNTPVLLRMETHLGTIVYDMATIDNKGIIEPRSTYIGRVLDIKQVGHVFKNFHYIDPTDILL